MRSKFVLGSAKGEFIVINKVSLLRHESYQLGVSGFCTVRYSGRPVQEKRSEVASWPDCTGFMMAVYDSRMMSAAEFREIALGFPEAEECSHTDHPDFRVGGKIFATLGAGEEWGMAKLTPTQQQEFLRISHAFKPAAGKWGEAGATIISLEMADAPDVHKALSAAWQNVREKRRSSRKT